MSPPKIGPPSGTPRPGGLGGTQGPPGPAAMGQTGPAEAAPPSLGGAAAAEGEPPPPPTLMRGTSAGADPSRPPTPPRPAASAAAAAGGAAAGTASRRLGKPPTAFFARALFGPDMEPPDATERGGVAAGDRGAAWGDELAAARSPGLRELVLEPGRASPPIWKNGDEDGGPVFDEDAATERRSSRRLATDWPGGFDGYRLSQAQDLSVTSPYAYTELFRAAIDTVFQKAFPDEASPDRQACEAFLKEREGVASIRIGDVVELLAASPTVGMFPHRVLRLLALVAGGVTAAAEAGAQLHASTEAQEVAPGVFLGSMRTAEAMGQAVQRGDKPLPYDFAFNLSEWTAPDLEPEPGGRAWVLAFDPAQSDAISANRLTVLVRALRHQLVRSPKARVLVHCVEGANRSAAMVVAYLLWLSIQKDEQEPGSKALWPDLVDAQIKACVEAAEEQVRTQRPFISVKFAYAQLVRFYDIERNRSRERVALLAVAEHVFEAGRLAASQPDAASVGQPAAAAAAAAAGAIEAAVEAFVGQRQQDGSVQPKDVERFEGWIRNVVGSYSDRLTTLYNRGRQSGAPGSGQNT